MPKVSLPPDAGTFPGLEHQGPEGRPVVAQILPQSQQAVPHADHAMGSLVIFFANGESGVKGTGPERCSYTGFQIRTLPASIGSIG